MREQIYNQQERLSKVYNVMTLATHCIAKCYVVAVNKVKRLATEILKKHISEV